MHSELPNLLFRARSVRELDRIAIEELGIPGSELMDRAGRAAFDLTVEKWPDAGQLTVVCGRGNNAGDGYVVARLAAERGMDVRVAEVGDPTLLKGDAAAARQSLERSKVITQPFAAASLKDAEVIVDGLFGTGLDRPLEGPWLEAVAAINDAPGAVLALDISSGLHADTGRIMGAAVRCEACVSFIGLKQGVFTAQGPDVSGEVHFNSLAVPKELYARVPADAHLDTLDCFYGVLGPRRRDAHKGRFGHVVIVGGDEGYSGAARLAAEAALRCGAGLVSVATRRSHAQVINTGRYEIMARGVETADELRPLLENASVAAVGPGLGRGGWGRRMLDTVLAAAIPTVIDADGLNLIAEKGDRKLPDNSVLTPHPGEAGRLLGTNAAAVETDRFDALAGLTQRFRVTCVLKGAGTLVAAPENTVHVCAHGNPGMASGGMGDVLSGVVAALIAQGLDAHTAARAGVCLHARAGDEAASNGERGTLASDLMPALRSLVNVF